MAQVQITDVVVPAEFRAYQVKNSMVSTALFQSGVVLPNGEMSAQLNWCAAVHRTVLERHPGHRSRCNYRCFGNTTLHSRFDVAIHPLGFAFTGASVASVSPVQAELALAANWTRAYVHQRRRECLPRRNRS